LYGGPYPFIQTGDVRAAEGRLTSFSQTYSEAGLAQSRLWPRGTLCITIAANIAETAILDFDACFPDSIVGFTATPEYCNSRFIEFFIRTILADLAAFAPATAQKNINLETLR
jgi:type I restriction enzyme S subunit